MSYLGRKLSAETNIFSLKLWVVIGIAIALLIVLILFVLCIWLAASRSSKKSRRRTRDVADKPPSGGGGIPDDSKEIREVKVDMFENPYLASHNASPFKGNFGKATSPAEAALLHPGFSPKVADADADALAEDYTAAAVPVGAESNGSPAVGYAQEGVDRSQRAVGSSPSERRGIWRIDTPDRASTASLSLHGGAATGVGGEGQAAGGGGGPEVSHLGWGHWFTLRELEAATDGFSEVNVLGEGGYGIVYRGQLTDSTLVAVKKLLNNRGQAEKEFRVEVDAIGRVRHKNLVRLLGYCAEGAQHRMLVYEYVDNGNLEQWLHGPMAASNALKWEERMKIAMGTAKGLSYLHEAIEPKVVHRDIKSSNILVDGQWNAKVSDFGLAKLLGSGKSHVTTRVMGTFGYVAPEYANTGLLNERSDVYSFGVLLMEIITGRDPIDYSRPAGEVNLVDWLKMMVGSRRSDEVADPNLEARPTSMALKRALLVALRCVDPSAVKRPKMGQVVHMLEAEDFPFKGEKRNANRDSSRSSRLTDTLTEDKILKRLSAKDSSVTRGDDGDTSLDSLHRLANAKSYRT